MARQKRTARAEFVLFDVLYDDDSLSSNRKVPGDLLGGFDGDDPALEEIQRQDQKIAEQSGKPRPGVKTVTRVKKKKVAKAS